MSRCRDPPVGEYHGTVSPPRPSPSFGRSNIMQPRRSHAISLARRALHRIADAPRHGSHNVALASASPPTPRPDGRHHQRRRRGNRAVQPPRTLPRPLRRDYPRSRGAPSRYPRKHGHALSPPSPQQQDHRDGQSFESRPATRPA